MRTLLVISALIAAASLANGYIVGNSCSSSSQCDDNNSFCKSTSGCRDGMTCVCKFGYLWNGDLSSNSNGNCLHRNYLQTGLACRVDLDCAGTITMDLLDYSSTTWGLGHQCISNKCACATNYEPINGTTPYGWIKHTCMPTTTTSTTTTTTPMTTTTSTTSTTTTPPTTTTSTTTTSTTSTTTTSTTTTAPTTTTTTATTTTTIPLRQWGQTCWDNQNGPTSTGCDPAKNLKCQPSDTCAPDVNTYYCYCANGWKNDGSGGCKMVELGDSCNVTSHCTYLGSLAYCNDDGVCDMAKPSVSAPVGVMCDKSVSSACADANAICRPHDVCEMYDMCQCKWGFFFNGYKCLPAKALKVGATCATDMDCMYQARRNPRDFSVVWMDKMLYHKCRSAKCACTDGYEPVGAILYGKTEGNLSIAIDVCTVSTTTASTTTGTTTTASTTPSTTTTTSTTSTTTTGTTTTSTTSTPASTMTATTVTTTTMTCPTGYEARADGVCRKYLSWGDQCMDVTWTSGSNQGYFGATIVCDPKKTLVCSDPDQCSMVGNSMRSCSCMQGWKQDGTGCRKIIVGDNCNTTMYCNKYINGGYCGNDGKCNSVFSANGPAGMNSGFTPNVSPLLVLLVLLVALFK